MLLLTNSNIKNSVLLCIGTVLLILSARVSIPAEPVPFTLQSLALLVIAGSLGRFLGSLVVILYLSLAALGLPILANGKSGIAPFFSPAGGYLWGFLVCGYIAGVCIEKGAAKNFFLTAFGLAIAHQSIFVLGVLQIKFKLDISWIDAFKRGYLPFFGADILKISIATIYFFFINKFIRNTSTIKIQD